MKQLLPKKVAIIGGGIAGLTIGYRLSKKGYSVTIFEKEPQVGGLARTVAIEGKQIEAFYHHFFKGDRELLNLLAELGLEDRILWQQSRQGIWDGKQLHDFSGLTDLLRLPLFSFVTRLRVGIASLVAAMLPFQLLKRITAKQLILVLMGQQAWEVFWRTLFEKKFGKSADEVSAVWFWGRIKARLGSRNGNGEVLGYLDGSFSALVNKLKEAIEQSGGKILTGTAVQKITAKDFYLVNGESFNSVVSTIPVNLLKKLTDLPAVQKLRGAEYCPAFCSLLVLSESFSKCYWTIVLDKKAPFEVLVEQSNLIEGNYYGGKSVVYVGSYSQQYSLKEQIDYLKNLNPKIEKKIIKEFQLAAFEAQPVIKVGYNPLPSQISKNFFITSLEHTYPFDRGVNFAVKEANKIVNLFLL